MKASKIILEDHLHFKKGLEIDLTFPEGHTKQHEPLDKICFLGQSGTGKTALLNLIKYCVCGDKDYNKEGIDLSKMVKGGICFYYRLDERNLLKVSVGDYQFEHHERHGSSKEWKKVEYPGAWLEAMNPALAKCTPLLINFPFCVVNPETNTAERSKALLDASTGELKPIPKRDIWDFDPVTVNYIWNIVFDDVANYITQYKGIKVELFDRLREKPLDGDQILKVFQQWELKHPNPIQALADNCLDVIFKEFNLKVDANLKAYRLEDSVGQNDDKRIVIRSMRNNEIVEYPFLSTGTKQVLLTAIPLYFLQPKNSIILFDQPETSIYPNVQIRLPALYQEIAPNNQFFFATHSPLLASSFDPWEIVELRFDPDGNVIRKEYYDTTKKRHVDNYFIDPKLLRWDSSYKILFDVNVEGTEERMSKLMELSGLEDKIKHTTDPDTKRALFRTYEDLARKLDWQVK
jgi:ABC-type lipoprotein export system ATPase subunit